MSKVKEREDLVAEMKAESVQKAAELKDAYTQSLSQSGQKYAEELNDLKVQNNQLIALWIFY